MKDFRLLDIPLHGVNLIEASAGTGKTYSITGLYLRLILEQNLRVNELLVVTFTEAATQELKDRIQTRLRDALAVFSAPPTADTQGPRRRAADPTLTALVEKVERVERLDRDLAKKRLLAAIRDFDEARIFTIHSFCRRMLHENAFESQSLFDTELITEQESLKARITADFWRRHLHDASPLFINYLLQKKVTPDQLLRIVGPTVSRVNVRVEPKLAICDIRQEEIAFRKAFAELQKVWDREAVLKIIADCLDKKVLNGNKYPRKQIAAWAELVDQFLCSPLESAHLPDRLDKFCRETLEGSTNKGKPPPADPVFTSAQALKTAAEKLIATMQSQWIALQVALFDQLRAELQERKKARNVQYFDDFLLNLDAALCGEGGALLRRQIRRRFKAALIDEFQDTDPLQYRIFNRLFGNGEIPFFLIGDPKQAIYAFRGADIFAYMEAAQQAPGQYTLTRNWRSEPRLIEAVNTVFANPPKRPFLYEPIPFVKVLAAEKPDREYLRIQGEEEGEEEDGPLQVWFMDTKTYSAPDARTRGIAKTRARKAIDGAVAGEVARLIRLGREKKAWIGEQPLSESDIAVLVLRHREAASIRAALARLGIPAVLYSTGSLFASPEAAEVQRVLTAIAHPNQEAALKTALAGDMLGLNGEAIDRLALDEMRWEERLLRFARYHGLWRKKGFIRMFGRFIAEEAVLPRLMAYPDGERRCTNLLHLAELLHRAGLEKKLHMSGLIKWLHEQRQGEGESGQEEYQLRLESDEKAVKLVTVHKSKGLQYRLVFCPYLWDDFTADKPPFVYHDPNRQLVLAFDEQHDRAGQQAAEERLAENLRLDYVALTRAIHRCYLVWGRFNQCEGAGLSYLLHPPAPEPDQSAGEATAAHLNALDDERLWRDMVKLSEKSRGSISLEPMPAPHPHGPPLLGQSGPTLDQRRFQGTIRQRFQVTSFSALQSQTATGTSSRFQAELPDYAAEIPPLPEPAETETDNPYSLEDLPKGAKTGTLLHALLESIDFTQPADAWDEPIARILQTHGFEPRWHCSIREMIARLVRTPLTASGLTLSRIPPEDRLNELGFYFPLARIAPERFRDIFSRFGRELPPDFPRAMEGLCFDPVKGFMRGFIDLVFAFEGRYYLIDWKSNHLPAYDRPGLRRAMAAHLYCLQYLIYSLALDRYLALRLPDYEYGRHFGGVFYIFLRGLDTGPPHGIFYDQPSSELIAALRSAVVASGRSLAMSGAIPGPLPGFS